MIRRVRLVLVLARPAVILLLALFAATGLAQAGHGDDPALLAGVLVVVVGFLFFSVACNDLADEAIDRVNLRHDRARPLVAGTAHRRELIVIAATGAVAALAVSASLHWPAIVVTAAGLAVSAGYSLRPVRVADRGALASLVLPACYVAVPYLIGIFAVRPALRPADLFLLAGLYIGFIGRILLKDFRDVRGDALFGKRTFLVRHGRRATCAFSAACWTVGTAVLAAATPSLSPALAGAYGACLLACLGLLYALAGETRPRRDEVLITGLAILGRGTIVTLLAHLAMTQAGWSALAHQTAVAALAALTLVQAGSMVRYGPLTRTRVMPLASAALATTSSRA
jgi:4-hydroxybenzoate polyprenyltransferase